MLGALLLAAAFPPGAHAAELFGGVHVHDVKTPLDDAGIESGFDLSLGYRGGRIGISGARRSSRTCSSP